MAIAQVQDKQATGRDTSSITVTLDATATAGNLLVLRAGGRNAVPSTPSGWTPVFFHDNSVAANAWFGFYYKVSDGTETGVTLSFPGGTRSAAQVEEWSNTEGWAADPVEAFTSDADESSAISSALPAVATGGHVLLMAGWGANSGGGGTRSYTDSFAEDFFGSSGGGSTEGASFGASREETVAGSYGVTASWVNSISVVGALVAFTVSSGIGPHVFFDLTDLPADFGNAETAEIVVRTRGVDIGATPLKLFAQIFQSDETTALSDEVEVAEETTDSSFTNSAPITFTGLNTTADKTIWDAARIRFRWGT